MGATVSNNNQPAQPGRKTLKDCWSTIQQAIGDRCDQVAASIKDSCAVIFPARVDQEERHGGFFSVVLQVTLWLAFGAFLFASLPHVAYFFAAFEPQDNNGNLNDYWWFVSYALAVAIDVTAFLLSLNVAVKMRRATRGLPWYQKFIPASIVFLTHWPFILLLVGFSWLVNFEHAKQFHSSMLAVAEDVNVNFWFWRGKLGDLNPVIASAFPLLAVAYTGMSDQIGDDRRQSHRQTPSPSVATTGNAAIAPASTSATTTANTEIAEALKAFADLQRQQMAAMASMNSQVIQAVEGNQRAIEAMMTSVLQAQSLSSQNTMPTLPPTTVSEVVTGKIKAIPAPSKNAPLSLEQKVHRYLAEEYAAGRQPRLKDIRNGVIVNGKPISEFSANKYKQSYLAAQAQH